AAYASAKREAKNFFADERVFIEKYIENPRHIEIQVFGDTQGNAVHLFERDCSIQRRHQKIVEETPAQIPQELKETMAEAALLATRSIDYQGAGTVEFIVSQENKFYFLEMNTRLQVEHPVTEMVSGVDLVALQIHIASGKSLQDFSLPGQPTGHSMELRIYAEDPQNNFLPDTGTIYQYQEPSGEGIRVDSGVVQGSAVSVYYDPMLAKLIVSSSNREQSLEIAKRALDDFVIQGIKTNQGYLQALLENLDFRKGNFTTHFLEEQQLEQKLSQKYKPLFLAVSHLLCNSFWQHPKPLQSVQLSFQRENFQSHPKTYQFYLQQEHCKFDRFLYNGEEYQILLERFGEESGSRQLQYSIGQKGKDEKESYNLLVQNTFQEGKLFLQDATCVYFYRYGLQIYLFYAGESCQISLLQRETLFQAKDGSAYTSPMPGKILKVFIETGQVVQKGDTLLVVEAMKMENEIKAQSQIQIEEILVQPGDLVALGQTLLTSKEDKEEKRYA
ncbi:MAG: biotin/lipoyl-containing protein, partial [Spirochaetota bacterium]